MIVVRRAPPNLDSVARIRLKDGEEVTVEADDLEVIRELGRGAYGVVEQMKHRPSGTQIAVKVSFNWILLMITVWIDTD